MCQSKCQPDFVDISDALDRHYDFSSIVPRAVSIDAKPSLWDDFNAVNGHDAGENSTHSQPNTAMICKSGTCGTYTRRQEFYSRSDASFFAPECDVINSQSIGSDSALLFTVRNNRTATKNSFPGLVWLINILLA